MRIVSYLNATTSFAANWDELRPIEGAPFQLTVSALQERYQFQNSGQSPSSALQGLMTPALQSGMFNGIPFNQLDFQSGAVVIGAATTEQTLKIAEDLFDFLNNALGFRKLPENRPRTYASILIADLGPVLSNMFSRWEKITSLVQKMMPPENRLLPMGVKFLTYKGNDAQADRQFIFERRVPTPPNEDWIFSQAPLDTETHVKVLEMIQTEFGK